MLHPKTAAALAWTVIVLFAAGAEPASLIGKAAAVRHDASGTVPGEAERPLATGDKAFLEEKIATSKTGDVQLLFLDESTLTVGPGSSLVLDRFVYDPSGGSSSLAVKVSEGVTRFIGGKISKGSGVDFHTPQATIAIRGGIAILVVQGAKRGSPGKSEGVLLFGIMTCTMGSEVQVVTTPGAACIVTDHIEVVELSVASIAKLIDSLQGTGAPAGGGFDGNQLLAALDLLCGADFSTTDPDCIAYRSGLAEVGIISLGDASDAERFANFLQMQTDPAGPTSGPGPSFDISGRVRACDTGP